MNNEIQIYKRKFILYHERYKYVFSLGDFWLTVVSRKKVGVFENTEEARSFAAHFRKVRAQQGMTQEALAFESGVGRITIARIETCKQNPSLDMIFTLAKALNVPPQRLFEF